MVPITPAQKRYTTSACSNPDCQHSNRPNAGNIGHRSSTDKHKHIARLRCAICEREFSEGDGARIARSKLSEDTVERLLQVSTVGGMTKAQPRSVRPISRPYNASRVWRPGGPRPIPSRWSKRWMSPAYSWMRLMPHCVAHRSTCYCSPGLPSPVSTDNHSASTCYFRQCSPAPLSRQTSQMPMVGARGGLTQNPVACPCT